MPRNRVLRQLYAHQLIDETVAVYCARRVERADRLLHEVRRYFPLSARRIWFPLMFTREISFGDIEQRSPADPITAKIAGRVSKEDAHL